MEQARTLQVPRGPQAIQQELEEGADARADQDEYSGSFARAEVFRQAREEED